MSDEIKIDKPEVQYWLDVGNKNLPSEGEFPKGFVEELFELGNAQKSRRDFLSILGFSILVPTVASCTRVPVTKAVGFLKREEGTTPGVANWYASTCEACESNCGLLVKTREGRPIKIEGNPDSYYSKGGVCAVGQASVLSLYDSNRFNEPLIAGKPSNWSEVDRAVPKALEEASQKGKILLVTGRLSSPSTLLAISKFKEKYKSVEHVVFEPYSYSALFDSIEKVYGVRTAPRYCLTGVESVVSVGADFLGTWYSPVDFAKGYSSARDIFARKGSMLRHIQFESAMSISGSCADLRVPLEALEESSVLAALLNAVSGFAGKKLDLPSVQLDPRLSSVIRTTATELWKNKGASLVLTGSNRVDDQVMALTLNELLGNTGHSIRLMSPSDFALSNDSRFENAVKDMEAGKVSALITVDSNPVYSYYDSSRLRSALSKVPLQISLNAAPDETTKTATYITPGNHFLESWNDHSSGDGKYSLTQPTIQPLRATRMFQESLLKWAGISQSFHDFIKAYWQKQIFPKQKKELLFESFWNRAVQDGIAEVSQRSEIRPSFKTPKIATLPVKKEGMQVLLYEKVGMRDGRHANNPWLQELPDPISKVTWDNYALLSPKAANEKGLKAGDVVTIQLDKNNINLPVLIQAGLGENTVAISVGYGRSESGKAGKGVGQNAYPFSSFDGNNFIRALSGVTLAKASGNYNLALTQTHHVMEGRDLVREVTKKEALHGEDSESKHEGKEKSLWPEHKPGENRWGMAIDLSKCTGCSACVVSCQAENNVPVVGREEVLNRREMHWIRIDRYYTGEESNPGVVHQPILCQHCENAPCETVCPVLATVHSSDGLNQQVYNRCVGTRYCANNCPYKVRRFNWFDYSHEDNWGRMALNPDIVVRSRGVMEKCSFCIQRVQEARLTAKKEGRKVADGDIKVACQQSCPSDAIVFGDLADPESKISKAVESHKGYQLLEELNVKPRVSFLPKVRNPL